MRLCTSKSSLLLWICCLISLYCVLLHSFCLSDSAAGLCNIYIYTYLVLFASSENGIIKSDKVYEVMLVTDRAHFSRLHPYMDSPQSIGTSACVLARASPHGDLRFKLTKPTSCLLTKRLSSDHQRPTHGRTLKTFRHFCSLWITALNGFVVVIVKLGPIQSFLIIYF